MGSQFGAFFQLHHHSCYQSLCRTTSTDNKIMSEYEDSHHRSGPSRRWCSRKLARSLNYQIDVINRD